MGFNKQTLQEIMSIIDDSKEHVKEADYLKMCNAIQFFHKNCPMFLNDTNTIQYKKLIREKNLIKDQLSILNSKSKIQSKKQRILNCHKQQVIENILEFSSVGPRAGYVRMSTKDISKYEKQIIEESISTLSELNDKYLSTCVSDNEKLLDYYMNEIQRLRLEYNTTKLKIRNLLQGS